MAKACCTACEKLLSCATMNDQTPHLRQRATTQAAEGLPRLKWSVADLDRMVEAGIFDESDRIELIGGELVPMSPKGIRHEIVRDELMNRLVRMLPADVRLSSEIGWRPDEDTYLEPDLLLYPQGLAGVNVGGSQVFLVIEVAQSSLGFDTGTKAQTYARLGVRDYWVVNAITLETRVHRGPSGSRYTEVTTLSPDQILNAVAANFVRLKLSDLGLE